MAASATGRRPSTGSGAATLGLLQFGGLGWEVVDEEESGGAQTCQ